MVPAPGGASSDARNVEFSPAEAHVPDSHLDADRESLFQQRCHRAAAERRFESEIQALVYGSFQKTSPFGPGSRVCLVEVNCRAGGQDSPGGFVGIEVVATFF